MEEHYNFLYSDNKPVHLENQELYAITITLNNLNQCVNKELELHTSLKKIWRWLKPWTDDVRLHAELSPIRNTVHYHGTFVMTDRIKYYHTLSKMIENIGMFKIKPIDNLQAWIDYYTKDQQIMKELFPGIPDEFTIKSYKEYIRIINKEKHHQTLINQIRKIDDYCV